MEKQYGAKSLVRAFRLLVTFPLQEKCFVAQCAHFGQTPVDSAAISVLSSAEFGGSECVLFRSPLWWTLVFLFLCSVGWALSFNIDFICVCVCATHAFLFVGSSVCLCWCGKKNLETKLLEKAGLNCPREV